MGDKRESNDSNKNGVPLVLIKEVNPGFFELGENWVNVHLV